MSTAEERATVREAARRRAKLIVDEFPDGPGDGDWDEAAWAEDSKDLGEDLADELWPMYQGELLDEIDKLKGAK